MLQCSRRRCKLRSIKIVARNLLCQYEIHKLFCSCSALLTLAALLCSVGRLVVAVVVGVGAAEFMSHHIGKGSNSNVEFPFAFL